MSGHRADSAVQKKGNDFATEVDLAIERQVVDALVSNTGIEVHGEEFGGADVDSPLVWVLDPIDGTFNYAAGLPTAAILLALVRDGEPVAGLTWLPFTDQRFTAVVGKPLYANGVAQPPLEPAKLADCLVGTGTFDIDSRGRFPGRYRIAILERLSRECSRMRMHGAIGLDLAYTAAGILGGDNQLRRTMSGTTRPASRWCGPPAASSPTWKGNDWTIRSKSALAGLPGVHGELLDIVRSAGDPEDY